jgi:hypothetical protein
MNSSVKYHVYSARIFIIFYVYLGAATEGKYIRSTAAIATSSDNNMGK